MSKYSFVKARHEYEKDKKLERIKELEKELKVLKPKQTGTDPQLLMFWNLQLQFLGYSPFALQHMYQHSEHKDYKATKIWFKHHSEVTYEEMEYLATELALHLSGLK
jgi:hypothetical protein